MPDQSSASTEHAIIQEITGPLEALPDDPLAVVNAEFPTALRGYDRVAVDDYVRKTRQLVAELQATRSPEAAVRRALERVGEQISGILQRAHDTAEQITAQSRSEAEDRLQQARAEAVEIAGAAEQRVRDLDADTDRIWLERQRIVADAEDLAGQLLALARTAAERFPADPEVDADATAPYDGDDEAATRPLSQLVADREGEGFEEEDFESDEELDEDPARDDTDVEETVAFEPLAPGDARAGDAQPADRPADGEAGDSEPADRPAAEAGDASPAEDETAVIPPAEDSTAVIRPADESTDVIPPASQAANRRRNR
jgi:DivIVA domain-containing protein